MRSVALIAALIASGIACPALAEANGTASSTAAVVADATIEKVNDMSLGQFAAGSGSGLLELNVIDGNRYCAATAVCAGLGHAFADFRIIGSVPVGVTFPSRIYFTGPAGPDMYFDVQGRELGGSMINPSGDHVSASTTGVILRLGGWLHMNPNQPNGSYSSSITVSVDYF